MAIDVEEYVIQALLKLIRETPMLRKNGVDSALKTFDDTPRVDATMPRLSIWCVNSDPRQVGLYNWVSSGSNVVAPSVQEPPDKLKVKTRGLEFFLLFQVDIWTRSGETYTGIDGVDRSATTFRDYLKDQIRDLLWRNSPPQLDHFDDGARCRIRFEGVLARRGFEQEEKLIQGIVEVPVHYRYEELDPT